MTDPTPRLPRECARDDGRPKVRYETRADAKAAARAHNVGEHAYRCRHCGYFHLGSTKATLGRNEFVDPISGRRCTLIVAAGAQPVVEHPDCQHHADVSIDLDAFYCPACSWSGRVSGAWVVYLSERVTA